MFQSQQRFIVNVMLRKSVVEDKGTAALLYADITLSTDCVTSHWKHHFGAMW